jgi:hypothetical protein
LKRYYTEYVRHCLRFYVRTLDIGSTPRFKTDVDKQNWVACDNCVTKLDAKTLELIKELYRPGDTIADKIYNLAREYRIPQDTIWTTINTLEHNIAKRRHLI